MKKRGSGILFHITSISSRFGIGDIGNGAYKFADFLAQTKQSFWQVLPLNPTNLINTNSPYSSVSAFAGNTILISPELMVKDGFLKDKDISFSAPFNKERVDYERVYTFKANLFNLAYDYFKVLDKKCEYEKFCSENASWLDDFAMFISFKEYFKGVLWSEWPKGIRDRDAKSMQDLKRKLSERIEKEKFLQYVFFKQWDVLKNYCQQKKIQLIGDIPIYVTYDSVDVWTNPSIFKLNKDKKPTHVAGVPPDYFSKTGQLWGNPVYDWNVLREQGYGWWIKRIEHNLKLFDWMRMDHFRGFVGYWQVPAGEETAVNGAWQKAPAKDFFKRLTAHFPELPIIAEDLGIITDDVKEIMKHFGFPGMKVLLFAFGEDLPTHPYLPHNYMPNCVVYTGTHDNNTIRGWFKQETTKEDKNRLFKYLGREVPIDELHWEFIRLAMGSVANIVIFPLQDVLDLPETDRMNLPGTVINNWQWRLKPEQLIAPATDKLLDMTTRYARG